MAAHLTSTFYLGADGLYDPGFPEVRMHSPGGVPNHVTVVFGPLSIAAFDDDGIVHLRNLASALEAAADRYESAARKAVPA